MMPIIWDLIESESYVSIYLDRENFKAEKPALIVLSGYSPLTHLSKLTGFEVWFGGFAKFEVDNKKAMIAKLDEILSTAKVNIRPRFYLKNGVTQKDFVELAHKFGSSIHQNDRIKLYEKKERRSE